MHKKFLILLVFIIGASIVLATALKNDNKKGSAKKMPPNKVNNSNFLLEGFPVKQVPLYKLSKVNSNKIFVNTDPKNSSAFGQSNFAYYNVVFDTNSTQKEFLDYYKNLFEKEIREDFENPDMVKGIIGQYKVTAAHYGSEDNSGYLQVHLSNFNDESIGQYFSSFPEIVEIDSNNIEHEKSYGLLNQKGGEIEFTKYFSVIDSGDADEFLPLEQKYQNLYKQKPNYSYSKEGETLEWTEGEYEVSLTLSRSHGRIYIMLRRPIDR